MPGLTTGIPGCPRRATANASPVAVCNPASRTQRNPENAVCAEHPSIYPIGNYPGDTSVRSITDLAGAITKRRSQLRLTQVDLAAAAGTGNRFIVELEQGKATVRADKVLAVLHELGLELVVRPVSRNRHVLR